MSSSKRTHPSTPDKHDKHSKEPSAQLEALTNALDDVPIDAETAHETVATLGIDVGALARGIRAKIAQADKADAIADREHRISEARRAYSKDVERLEHRKVEPSRTREEQLVIFENLLKKAPPHASLAMHFHKYESASKEELAELIRGLRHLLGEDE